MFKTELLLIILHSLPFFSEPVESLDRLKEQISNNEMLMQQN